jgi:hypothetical protein
MRKLFAIAALCLSAFAQDQDPAVSISGGPPIRAWTAQYFYVPATTDIEYICSARVSQNPATLAVTQIVDATNTATVTTPSAHGLAVGNRVTIAGVTGDTDLNRSYVIQTVGSTTTFTVTSANVTDSTYNNAGITLRTTAPRTTQPIWAIKRFFYSGTDLVATRWAVNPAKELSSTAAENICDNRATLAYQ